MRVIPAVKNANYYEGDFIFNKNTTLNCPYENISKNINGFLQKSLGFSLDNGNDIIFKIDSDLVFDEGYLINIDNNIVISAKTEKGLFYGAQTLKQLIYFNFKKDFAKIKKALIDDKPRFEYRGFMFDCCRHFFDVEIVKKYIDAISMFKFNVFHWHLTEDQGWRVEIDKYPNLTKVGSQRKETRGDKTPHGGYYTKAQIEDVVNYAKDRYIDVIPEFDMPGHTRAVVASYPELSCKGQPIEVATKFGIYKDILCGGNEKTYNFINDILDEFSALFPAKYIHLGGDEAIKTEWYKCQKCQDKVKDLGLKNTEQLQGYMTNKAVEHSKKNDKTVICWNESANSGMLDSSVVLQYWNDGAKKTNVLKEVKNGRKLIVSSFKPYYLDYPYAMHSLKAVYNYEPLFKEIVNYEKNILGVETPIWTEYIDNEKILGQRVFPRLVAVSEGGWALPKNKDYDKFISVLPKALKALECQTGIVGESIKKCNPNIFEIPFIMLKFSKNLIDFDLIKRSYVANKEMKKLRKINN